MEVEVTTDRRLMLKSMNAHLNHGERRRLYQLTGMKETRGKDLLTGRLYPSDADDTFLNAVFDLAYPRLMKYKKLNAFAV